MLHSYKLPEQKGNITRILYDLLQKKSLMDSVETRFF
jgi:hypothetical protein